MHGQSRNWKNKAGSPGFQNSQIFLHFESVESEEKIIICTYKYLQTEEPKYR